MLPSGPFIPLPDGTFCFLSGQKALLFIENKITFVQSGNCGDPVLEIGYSYCCPFPSCLVGLSLLITYYSFPGLSTRFFLNPICSLGISFKLALPPPSKAAAQSVRFSPRRSVPSHHFLYGQWLPAVAARSSTKQPQALQVPRERYSQSLQTDNLCPYSFSGVFVSRSIMARRRPMSCSYFSGSISCRRQRIQCFSIILSASRGTRLFSIKKNCTAPRRLFPVLYFPSTIVTKLAGFRFVVRIPPSRR